MKGFKKILSFVLAIAMVATLAPAMPAKAAGELDGQIIVLHTNDAHGQMENGGYQKLAAYKSGLESKGAEVLLFDAGDFSQGSVYVADSKGKSAVEMMNLVGYTAATMGNHEIDYGLDNLLSLKSAMKFDFLVSSFKIDGSLVFDAGKVYTLKSGVKVGVFGLNTPETQTKTNPANYTGKNVDFASGDALVDIAKAEVTSLKGQGADIIICLSHLGIDAESATGKNRSVDVFSKVEGVDIVIDGHSHSSLADMQAAATAAGITKTVMTSTTNGLTNIGQVTITKDTDGYKYAPTNVATENITDTDTVVATYYNTLKAQTDAVYSVKVATSEVTLPGEKDDVRKGEAVIGDLVTEAMLWKASQLGLSPDLAITNGGGLRKTIAQGDVTAKDIFELLPFFNTLSFINIKGKYILEALEASTYAYPEIIGGFPQVSGIEFIIDATKKYDAGDLYPGSTYARPKSINRVTIKSIGGQPYDPEKVYHLVVNDFMYAGGDTYYVLKPNATSSFDTGTSVHMVVLEYIDQVLKGVIPASKYSKVAGNITIIDPPEEEPATSKPIYHYYNKNTGDHFYTPKKSKAPAGYTEKGVAFTATGEKTSKAYYTLKNNKTGRHIISNKSKKSGYTYVKGTGFRTSGKTKIYRLYNIKNKAYYYTTDESEYDKKMKTGKYKGASTTIKAL